MLLIDGVKYHEWTPKSEEEFERIVNEHASEMFGDNSKYIDKKLKLQSLSGIGSIPDGYVIVFGASPEWHIVEVELSSHPLYEHIVSQVSKFINGISNPNIQKNIVNAIDGEINRDDFLRLRLKKAVEPTEIHRFLADLISKQPILTIIIEKDTEELREALSTLRYPQIKVVEFRTFVREGVGLAVHANLFEPIYAPAPSASLPLKPLPVKAEEGGGKYATWRNTKTGEVKSAKEVYETYFLGTLDGTAKAGAWNTRVLPSLHTKGLAKEWEVA